MTDGTDSTHDAATAAPQSPIGEPRLSLTDDPPGNGAATAPPRVLSIGTLQELEDRVRRLEERYAALQDAKGIEDRVVQRITTRLKRKPSMPDIDIRNMPPPSPVAEGGVMGEPHLAPSDGGAALQPPLAQAGWKPTSQPIAASDKPAAASPLAQAIQTPVATAVVAPVAVEAPPVPAAAIAVAAVAPPTAAVAPAKPPRGRWAALAHALVIFEAVLEVRVMLRMVGDPRYRMTWLGRLVPIIFLAVFFLSDLDSTKNFFPWNMVPMGGGWILNKAVILVLGFVAFKVLMREVHRYQQTIPDAPGAQA